MKIAEYESECFLCEDRIKVGDEIQYDGSRKAWEHLVCPWESDPGYRPDMVIIDAGIHERNKEKDREFNLETIDEQLSGIETGETAERGAMERLWNIIQDFFCN